jgi:hypothetical protein
VIPEATENVDWKNIGNAMKASTRARRVFITKKKAGMCGVGKFMKQWKEWDNDRYLRCGEQEDAEHVWRCRGTGTKEIWLSSLGNERFY